MCDYMRMEMVVLMERIHCIQIEAFSRRDNCSKWWELGVLRSDHFNLVKQDAGLGYIHSKLFRNFQCPTLEEMEHVRYDYASSQAFIIGDLNPVYRRDTYLSSIGNDRTVQNFTDLEIQNCQNKHGITSGVVIAMIKAIFAQLQELCKAHEISLSINHQASKRKNKIDPKGHSGTEKSPISLSSPFTHVSSVATAKKRLVFGDNLARAHAPAIVH
jgi:hypothetical protein